MTDRIELLESAIDSLPEGFALLHGDSCERVEVAFWNQAAAAITGHAAIELVGCVVPESLLALPGDGSIHDSTHHAIPDGTRVAHGNRITSAPGGAACLPL
jgi:hypothetical protein